MTFTEVKMESTTNKMVPQLVLLMTTTTRKENSTEISVIFPAYNEEKYIEPAVMEVRKYLDQFSNSYEVIIAEDGSTDGTAVTAENLAKKFQFVKHIHRKERLGRGTALNNAFRQSKGNILVYMDLDLATDLKYLKPLVEAISVDGYDFATGSRMLPESKVERTLRRGLVSKIYNFMVRKILGSTLRDHQCGFKAFKRDSALKLIEQVDAHHWFWDTELLVRATRNGYTIKEIPVEWKSGHNTKVNLIKDSYQMGTKVLKLWWKLRD